MRFLFILLGLLLFFSTPLSALIGDTLHNLSATNTHVQNAEHPELIIKAVTETEECVFCHIPHLARPSGSPLWNRGMPDSDYSMYESDYLKRIGYPEATSLGTLTGEPGTRSRQCLSCHDGTIAIGSIYKLRQDIMNGASIIMAGTEGDMMPSTSPAKFGTDLTNHHPVGFEYDPSHVVAASFGVGIRTTELKAIPTSPIKLYSYNGVDYVECASCHDPHTTTKKFLRVNGGTHAQNIVNTCIACHERDSWVPSIHNTSDADYTDTAVKAIYSNNAVTEVRDMGCINCHTPHNGEGTPYLFRKVEQQTCFQGAGSSVGVTPCHGTGASIEGVDIESILNRTYAHPVNTIDAKHTNLDGLYGYDVGGSEMTDVNGVGGVSWDSNKHAECMDCHNPHKTQAGTHVSDGSVYGTPTVTSNLISPVLKGVTGVEPIWPVEWTQPTTFTTLESSTKEYQICFKCHSYWGLGNTPSPNSPATAYPSLSEPNVNITDVAWEMNKNNKSGHPVVFPNTAIDRPGSTVPQALRAAQMKAPWTPGATMYCSDCHGSDNEHLGIDPKGPHGSNAKFMLKGIGKNWPTDEFGDFYNIMDIPYLPAENNNIFCSNCHNLETPHRDWGIWAFMNSLAYPEDKLGAARFTCVACHVAIPHGSPVSRLISYSSFPEPYNYEGNSSVITGFRKAEVFPGVGMGVFNVSAPTCGGTGGQCHDSVTAPQIGSYDLNLMP